MKFFLNSPRCLISSFTNDPKLMTLNHTVRQRSSLEVNLVFPAAENVNSLVLDQTSHKLGAQQIKMHPFQASTMVAVASDIYWTV